MASYDDDKLGVQVDEKEHHILGSAAEEPIKGDAHLKNVYNAELYAALQESDIPRWSKESRTLYRKSASLEWLEWQLIPRNQYRSSPHSCVSSLLDMMARS